MVSSGKDILTFNATNFASHAHRHQRYISAE